MIPILVTITNSFMSDFEITNRYTEEVAIWNAFMLPVAGIPFHYAEMSLIPKFISFAHYIRLFFVDSQYLVKLWNSLEITLPVVVGQLLIAPAAAYVFAFGKIKYKEILFFMYIVIMFMPLQVVLVPHYMIARFFHIETSRLAIILPALFSPFGVFLLRQYMRVLPYEYVEAAKMDGANHGKILFSIIIPMVKPAIAALAILISIEYWNTVEQSIIFIKDINFEPLSVYLSRMDETNYGLMLAASCVYMFPALLVQTPRELEPTVLPSAAIRTDGRDHYVFYVERQQERFGEAYYIRKLPVTVGYVYDAYTALVYYEPVQYPFVVNSDRLVQEGDRVNLVNGSVFFEEE